MSSLTGGEGSQEAPCLPAGLWAASGTASVPLLNPFPVPHVPGPKLPGKALRHLRTLAAPCRSRQLCRMHLLHNVNGVIDFLNWMTGHRGQIAAGEASDAQVGVQARVATAVREATSGSPAIPNTRSAFLELTKGRSLYGDSANVNLSSFSSIGRVSLPSDLQDAPELMQVAPSSATHFLENEE